MNTAVRPMVLDLSRYPAYAIRNVCNWLYYGSVSILTDPQALTDHLNIADVLGIVFLHRQLEQTLIHLAQKGRIIQILNTASCPKTGESATTNFELVLIMAKMQIKEAFSSDKISQLSLRAVITLVSSRVKQYYKTALINVALH